MTIAWRVNVFGQVVKMTPMQLREYMNFTFQRSLPTRSRRRPDWSRARRGSKKHVADVTCEFWKADDIGQTFTGFPFRNPDRPTRHGSQMWFYAPPSFQAVIRAFHKTKPTPATNRLQRLEDAVARMTTLHETLCQRVEKLSAQVRQVEEDLALTPTMDHHAALQDELTELKRDLDRAQLRGANGDVLYTT